MNLSKRTQFKRIRRQRRIRLAIFVLVVILVWGFISLFKEYQNYQLTRYNKYPIRGVSLTQDDGYVDFVALKSSGQTFVYLRATQGAIFSDNNFDSNYQRSTDAGINVGVYHVFSFESSVKRQLKNFATTVDSDIGNLPIAVQMLTNNPSFSQLKRYKSFINSVQSRYHIRVIAWASKKNYLRLADKKILFWNQQATNGKNELIEINCSQPIRLDGDLQNFHQVIFNGSKKDWQRNLNN